MQVSTFIGPRAIYGRQRDHHSFQNTKFLRQGLLLDKTNTNLTVFTPISLIQMRTLTQYESLVTYNLPLQTGGGKGLGYPSDLEQTQHGMICMSTEGDMLSTVQVKSS